jgi:hypothetical protein
MKVRADVNQAGTIVIAAKTPGGGRLREYLFDCPEKMHSIAKDHDWVVRSGKNPIEGKKYSLRMAKNDFRKAEAIQIMSYKQPHSKKKQDFF